MGQAEQELTFAGNALRVDAPGYPIPFPQIVNATGVKAGWIRLNDEASENIGRGLLAWTMWTEAGPRAAHASAVNWLSATPAWTAVRSDDPDAAIRWPTPRNICKVFPSAGECNNITADWPTDGRFSHVHAVLWPGLDDMAAIVTSCGLKNATENPDDQAVCINVSVNRGDSFRVPFILSIPTHADAPTSGYIDPTSVQATVAYFGERQNGNIGEAALPIYVSWRNRDLLSGKAKYFFTRVIVGATGDIAEASFPREINMPEGQGFAAGNHATVFGYRHGQRERIAVAYSDRADKESPADCTQGPGAPTNVSWYVAQSDDLGLSWGCFTGINDSACLPNTSVYPPGSSSQRTLLTSSTGWRPCVGAPSVEDANLYAKNNDRPEVVVHAPALSNGLDDSTAAQMFFFAVNKKHSSQSRQRIEVFRTGAQGVLGSSTQNLFQSVWQSSTSGLMDSWGQSLSVISRNGAVNDQIAGISVAYRTAEATNGGLRTRVQQWRESIGASFLAPQNQEVTGTAQAGETVPPLPEAPLGLQVGIANLQRCGTTFDGCQANSSAGNWPDWGVLVGWEDGRRNTSLIHEVFARGGNYQ